MKQATQAGHRSSRPVLSVFFLLLCVTVIALLSSCSYWDRKTTHHAKPAPPPPEPPKEFQPYFDVNLGCPLPLVTNPILYVFKEKRRLLVVDRGILVREYRVGLGSHPVGDKVMRGDGRTPEGEFFVCVKNPGSRFYKSLGLNYPTPRHAQEAVNWGKISQEQYRRIVDACSSQAIPPWNTPLGGAIMIHGGGTYADWTEGCVAVQNSAMDELFQIVSVGTPVVIMP